MTDPFLISDDRLRTLSATRQGRISIAGYNYQAAYAVARLASMAVRRSVLNLQDWPVRMRYDWGEDLDEVCEDSTVRFTQCKRVANIGQAASLATVLIGFAGKWLWTPAAERERLRFRLVCTDSRLADESKAPGSLKAQVRRHFLTTLNEPAGAHSDRAAWITDARAASYESLFEGLWNRFDCLYLSPDIVDYYPAGPRMAAEKEALRVLLESNQIDAAGQISVLARLRRLIHDNLITFDPTNESLQSSLDRKPRRLDRADVRAAIDPWRPAPQPQPPFQLVDRTFLSEQRELERQQFVARQPSWCDVAHGYDEVIKFIERDQTEALEAAVVEKLVARIGRAGKLPALFVAGAPGDGKTTMVRRVAARLVDAGELLIADTGVGLREPPGEPDEYVQAIERLQGFGRPVVLLLDDPLYADSPWINVLKKLNRPGLQLGVLAASPQFLLDEHKQQLRMCDLSVFEMARTSQTERESLAAVYGRTVTSESVEDFLVAAMQAATGIPFSEVIHRLWLTLADGRDLSSARSLTDLPWQTRAYLFVCFFSRAYAGCPQSLLLKLLEMSGGIPGTTDLYTELQRMKHFGGWHIFRIGHRAKVSWRQRVTGRAKALWDHREPLFGGAHAVISREAWNQRPLPWCDVGEKIIEASIINPETVREVANLGVRLQSASFASSANSGLDPTFLTKLTQRWLKDSSVETRWLCDLAFILSMLGKRKLALSFQGELMRRCKPDSQGWVAAMRLWFLGIKIGSQEGFREVDILALINSADFSIAPTRVSPFGLLIEPIRQLWDAFINRLLDAFDGKLEWNLEGNLLGYLLTVAKIEQLSPRLDQIMSWLAMHPDDSNVRTQFLSFLLRQSPEFAGLWTKAAHQTAKWLEEHPDDCHVRTKYLWFLRELPTEYSEMRVKAAQQTAKWLEEHLDDHQVRTIYLSFLRELPTEYSEMRVKAAQQTAKWLEEHPDDHQVRTKYLSFLRQLPTEYSEMRVKGARQTAKWLEEHPDDHQVRTIYLSFLGQFPAELSDLSMKAARETAKWIANDPEDENVRCQFMSFLSTIWERLVHIRKIMSVSEWQQLASESLRDGAELICRSGYQRHHEGLLTSSPRLHLMLLHSLALRESREVRNALKVAHEVAAEWCARNRSSGLRLDLALPEEPIRSMAEGTGLEPA